MCVFFLFIFVLYHGFFDYGPHEVQLLVEVSANGDQ